MPTSANRAGAFGQFADVSIRAPEQETELSNELSSAWITARPDPSSRAPSTISGDSLNSQYTSVQRDSTNSTDFSKFHLRFRVISI
jgi:hypothetical protein